MASNRLYIDMEKKFPMMEKIKVKANEKFTNPIEQIKHDSIGRKIFNRNRFLFSFLDNFPIIMFPNKADKGIDANNIPTSKVSVKAKRK